MNSCTQYSSVVETVWQVEAGVCVLAVYLDLIEILPGIERYNAVGRYANNRFGSGVPSCVECQCRLSRENLQNWRDHGLDVAGH